jgi:hypothetical protein
MKRIAGVLLASAVFTALDRTSFRFSVENQLIAVEQINHAHGS